MNTRFADADADADSSSLLAAMARHAHAAPYRDGAPPAKGIPA